MGKNLERITWNKKSWRKQDGTEINPKKIGDSFIRITHRGINFFEEESKGEEMQELLVKILEMCNSSEYISKEQITEINAYSSQKLKDLSIYAINFYKI